MRNELYYAVKPLLPRELRLALRRLRARYIRMKIGNNWPIYEPTGMLPEGWPGWPGQSQFAFVLSHDVEGTRGLNRCRQLAEIEMAHGFRSSFNFIPKGEYRAPANLLQWLRTNGFEIGIHDLHHDGTLLSSKRSFKRAAEVIDRQSAAWDTVGFRAGFMLHQLDWFHFLNVEYDASTFDVDPFEPQPDGVETIFPFWIPAPDPEEDAHPISQARARRARERARGYVEMPYTLIQDFNLFLVLRERTTQFWDRKLAWIAGRGGMALMNTHPDFMAIGGGSPGADEYPVELYSDFLKRVRQVYGSNLYHDVPREVARHARAHMIPQRRPPRQVCMVVYNTYEGDNRVRRYAESLARRGDKVTVFSLADEVLPLGTGELEGVRVVRLFQPDRQKRGKGDYFFNYARFWWKAFCAMQPRNFPGGCDLVHVHNMPEALVFAAMRLKRRGAKIILDLHDLMPELAEDKFRISDRHILSKLLRSVEAWACRFADHVIISNHLWKKTVADRSRRDGQLTALINHVDLKLFHRRVRNRDDSKFVIVYPGSLNYHQGLDIAVNAMVEVRKAVPTAELHIYSRGSELSDLAEQAERLGIAEAVVFPEAVPLSEIGTVMANADLGVVPKRADGFGNEAFSTKIMEFMSQGLPVVASRTKIDTYYYGEDCVCFFEAGNAADLADKIIMLARDPQMRQRLSANASQLVKSSSWEAAESIYFGIVDRLTRTRMPPSSAVARRFANRAWTER